MSVRNSPFFLAAAAVLSFLVAPAGASAQMVLTSLGSPSTETFSSWSGLGLTSSPISGELDSYTWRVEGLSDGDSTWGGWHSSGDFARGAAAGGVSTGGLYAFYAEGASNPALGLQPTASDATPGYVTLRVYNQTGVTVDRVEVSFDACYYNDEDRSATYVLQYSTDDSSYTDTSATSYTPEVGSLSPSWTCVPFTSTLTGLSLSNLSYLYVRWYVDDLGGSGSRDELAIDDVSVTALAACFSSTDCDDGSECTTDTCSSGVCIHTPRTGTSCSDGDACNGAETCNSDGVCASGTPLDCDDLDPCTADSCDAVTGCAHDPISGCGGEDAGTPTDAGTPVDAGTGTDAGPRADAGPGTDAGTPTADGGSVGADGGGLTPRPRTGARRGGCSAAGPGGGLPAPWALLGLGLLALWRRRRG